MSFDLNEVNLIGRITSPIEVKQTPSGVLVANFSIATNEVYTDKQGERQNIATFHSCVAWNNTAKILESYAVKGSKVYAKGKLQNKSWEDKDGGKRYKTEIVVNQVILLDVRRDNGSAVDEVDALPDFPSEQEPKKRLPSPKSRVLEPEITIDDIPF